MAVHTRVTAKSIILLCSSLALALGLSYWLYKNISKGKLVSVVGGIYQIYESEVDYQDALDKLTVPDKVDREFALKKLEKMWASYWLMEKNDWKISEADLAKEADRIEKNTKAPELIKRIKDLPQTFHGEYLNIFARGVLIERSIFRDFYAHAKSIHQDNLKRAADLLVEVQNTKETKKVAQSHHLYLKKFKIGANLGYQLETAYSPEPPPPKEMMENDPRPKEGPRQRNLSTEEFQYLETWFKRFDLVNFKSGIYPKVMEEEDRFLVVEFTSLDPSGLQAEGFMIEIPKVPFQDWYAEALKTVSIQRY